MSLSWLELSLAHKVQISRLTRAANMIQSSAPIVATELVLAMSRNATAMYGRTMPQMFIAIMLG